MKKNEKGIALSSLLLIIAIAIVLIILVINIKNNNNGNTTLEISLYIKKESRSTYIPKCTTIDYTSLARNPNQYKGNNYKFTGEVIQVMNDNNDVILRVNVTPKRYQYSNEIYYEDTILVAYEYSSSYESRILEEDIITIYGQFIGTYTYEAIWGNLVTVPSINAMYIDIETK